MRALEALVSKSKGQIAAVVGGLVVGVVMLFVGLFMIAIVSDVTGLCRANLTPENCWIGQNESINAFAGTQTELISTTGTIFSVLGLVIIIVALATAISSLRGVTGEGI